MNATDTWFRDRVTELKAIAAELPELSPVLDEYPGHGYPPTLHFPEFNDQPWNFYVAAPVDSHIGEADQEGTPGDICAVDINEFVPVRLDDPKATAATVRQFLAKHRDQTA